MLVVLLRQGEKVGLRVLLVVPLHGAVVVLSLLKTGNLYISSC